MVEFVRAPGRVNIIGEHTDYNGLPVLPMAIDREIVIAYEPLSNAEVALANADSDYPPLRFELSGDIEPYETGHWGNYVKAAAQAIYLWAAEHSPGSLPLFGLRGTVAGTIPPRSGLSSSSALAVAAACAFVAVNRLDIGRAELAELMARAERYVGTEGGGMDQAVSIMAERGAAIKIDFFPLRARTVKLPKGYAIAVANSLVSANKTGEARSAYNTRVAECKLGLELLKSHARKRYPGVESAVLLRDFAQTVPEWRSMLDHLPGKPVTVDAAAGLLGISTDDLARKCLSRRDGTPLPVPEAGFQPKRRCRHVLSEGERVELVAAAMERGDAAALGRLMDESHASCAEDYEISCPELDDLVGVMRRNGALGARLTGAGFGGCAVALVKSSEVEQFLDGVWRGYYRQSVVQRDEVLFACHAVAGAGPIAL